jgi:acyl-CoA synthetase (AMP-forming)/AMP-acid ligase II
VKTCTVGVKMDSGHPSTAASVRDEWKRFVEDPPDRERPFVLGRATQRDVYLLQEAILEKLRPEHGKGRTVTLATQDRSLIAASVLASLAGGPVVLIPHSLSTQVIAELGEGRMGGTAITDGACELPAGMTGLTFRIPGNRPQPIRIGREPDETFVGLFTGGSTGRPRLWNKTPLGLIGEAEYLAKRFEIGPDDVILAAVPPLHIYGILFSVLLPLVSGASVLDATPFYRGEIEKNLQEMRPTLFVGAPPHYRVLGTGFSAPDSLRLAFSSGGFLPEEISRAFFDETGIAVTEIYGSTETGGIAVRSPSAGRVSWEAYHCVDWRIEEERLCVKSPFLSPGLRLDDRGFFRTGDRVEATGGRAFTLLGRADGIVKVGGRRVDLAGVEARLKGLPQVDDAYVFVLRSGTMRENEIAALLVPKGEREGKGVPKQLSSILEPWEVPRRVKWVEQVPTTATGKRDLAAATELLSKTD